MKIKIVAFSIFFFSFSSFIQAAPPFIGEVDLHPPNCQIQKKCFTTQELYFTDSSKKQWYAPKNTKTDGASFPTLLEPAIAKIVGDRYDPIIMKAVVLHDHYMRKPVRSWYQTNRMFYEALLASGTNKTRAKLMYAGVLVGSKVWHLTIKGNDCPNGNHACTWSTIKETIITTDAPALAEQSTEYKNNFDSLAKAIINNDIDLEDIERRAIEVRPVITEGLSQKNSPSLDNGEKI